jgi:tetratricopeptide (TPR) repeat protein
MKWRIAFLAVFLSAGVLGPAFAQTELDKARIDYEAAKLALQQDQPAVALAKFEQVLAVLGEQADLLCLAAQAALAAGRDDKAREYQRRAFTVADDEFKASPGYKRLIEISARLDLTEIYWFDVRNPDGVARAELRGQGRAWLEWQGGRAVYTWNETGRDSAFIYLTDQSRGMRLAVPVKGGKSRISGSLQGSWQDWNLMFPKTGAVGAPDAPTTGTEVPNHP